MVSQRVLTDHEMGAEVRISMEGVQFKTLGYYPVVLSQDDTKAVEVQVSTHYFKAMAEEIVARRGPEYADAVRNYFAGAVASKRALNQIRTRRSLLFDVICRTLRSGPTAADDTSPFVKLSRNPLDFPAGIVGLPHLLSSDDRLAIYNWTIAAGWTYQAPPISLRKASDGRWMTDAWRAQGQPVLFCGNVIARRRLTRTMSAAH